MKKILISILVTFLLTTPSSAEVKRADLAGKWYTDSREALRAELESYLDEAKPKPVDGEIIGLISPHAGFVFSGPVAAYGFKAVEKQDIETVVVVGFSHRRRYDFIAILNEEGFETPLGIVKIDKPLTEALIRDNPKIHEYLIAFAGENSLEMQIPFLQAALKDFKVVLLAMGEQSFENSRLLGRILYDALKDKKKYLLIASTDMSHYLPYGRATALDEKTISLIKEFKPDKLYKECLAEKHKLMCGCGAVSAVMIAAKKLGAEKIKVLKYANSGDTAGNKDEVVGYLSAVLVKSQITNSKSQINHKSQIPNPKQGDENMLNEVQRKKMLKLARDSIMHYLKTGKTLEVKESDPVLNKEMGAFVTLHERGKLRGCIGNMVGRGPFYLTVRDMAKEAATGDPRFRPVTLREMKDIDIEISALSPMEKIEHPDIIEVGKHGVMVKGAFRSGVYLPQVATETGWNREQFMNSLCGQKAGMAPDAWKKGECDIYVFTAEVFGEKNDK